MKTNDYKDPDALEFDLHEETEKISAKIKKVINKQARRLAVSALREGLFIALDTKDLTKVYVGYSPAFNWFEEDEKAIFNITANWNMKMDIEDEVDQMVHEGWIDDKPDEARKCAEAYERMAKKIRERIKTLPRSHEL